MNIKLSGVCGLAIAGLAIIGVADSRAQESFGDAAVMLEFQRAADSYAFSHRQLERRGEGAAIGAEGTLFTPLVADAFRKRIRRAAAGACKVSDTVILDFSVPRVNMRVDAPPVPDCVRSVLPPLPDELDYGVAGVALLLVDAHLHIVVDVLHAAFPVSASP